jgi:hypothetical protein
MYGALPPPLPWRHAARRADRGVVEERAPVASNLHGLAIVSRRWAMRMSALCAAVAAIVSAACSGGAVVVVGPTGASAGAPITVSVAAAATSQATFTGGLCQVGTVITPTFITPTFNIAVIAATTVSVDHLTVQMIDGTHLGGPMVTIPQADVTRQFGTLVIVGGTQRVFTVRPRVACGASPWRSVSAQVAVRDSHGATFVVAADSPVS